MKLVAAVAAVGLVGCQCSPVVPAPPKPCPLTLGVCADTFSYPIDGGWSACDYGPEYEATERKCDGLDNDCDGRVDVSVARVLIAGDAGFNGSSQLQEFEVYFPKLVQTYDLRRLSLCLTDLGIAHGR